MEGGTPRPLAYDGGEVLPTEVKQVQHGAHVVGKWGACGCEAEGGPPHGAFRGA